MPECCTAKLCAAVLAGHADRPAVRSGDSQGCSRVWQTHHEMEGDGRVLYRHKRQVRGFPRCGQSSILVVHGVFLWTTDLT